MKNGLISKEDFLTSNTADGLRVTLKSTIDLTEYLLNKCGFNYVLTNKMNQDSLEVRINKYTLIIFIPNHFIFFSYFLELFAKLQVLMIILPHQHSYKYIKFSLFILYLNLQLLEIVNCLTLMYLKLV